MNGRNETFPEFHHSRTSENLQVSRNKKRIHQSEKIVKSGACNLQICSTRGRESRFGTFSPPGRRGLGRAAKLVVQLPGVELHGLGRWVLADLERRSRDDS